MQVGIDHTDPLAHVLKRRFQQALVETQVLAGLTHDRNHGVEVGTGLVDAALLAERRVQ